MAEELSKQEIHAMEHIFEMSGARGHQKYFIDQAGSNDARILDGLVERGLCESKKMPDFIHGEKMIIYKVTKAGRRAIMEFANKSTAEKDKIIFELRAQIELMKRCEICMHDASGMRTERCKICEKRSEWSLRYG